MKAGTTIAGPHAGNALNIAVIYQDAPTAHWAGQAREQIVEAVGQQAIRCTEWRISDLRGATAFSGGAAALAQADVIVVSLYAAERLPAAFYL